MQSCKTQNRTRLQELLNYASEPNETNLGMKTLSCYGKGTTSFELVRLFWEFYKIVQKSPYVESNPLALCMYIKNFAEDKMSDLITNIIRKQLYVFTIKQLDLWNIDLSSKETNLGYYWDYKSLIWKPLIGQPLIIEGRNILLVPKSIVRNRYVFNVECYIKQYILSILQEHHLETNSDKCTIKFYKNGNTKLIPPTKKDLYKEEVSHTIHKDFAFNYSQNNKFDENNYINDILSRIRSGYGSLTDCQLDDIVYRKYGEFNARKAS